MPMQHITDMEYALPAFFILLVFLLPGFELSASYCLPKQYRLKQ